MSDRLLLPHPHPAALVTPNFVFHSDGTATGDAAVHAMQDVCERDYAAIKAIFGLGDIPGLPIDVTVDPGAGGAFHQTCADTGIHLIPEDAATLLVAEHVECFSALSGRWNCGATPGEGLSRALAQVVRPGTVLGELDGDVQGWWAGGQPEDWVNANSPGGDRDNVANACATLFLFWLRSQLGLSWKQIVGAGGRTLADCYRTLTGRPGSQGWTDFVAALRLVDVGGRLQVPGSGNPFPTSPPVPAPSPPPAPPPPPTPTPPPPIPPSDEPLWWERLEQHYPGLAEWLERYFGKKTLRNPR